MDLVPQEGISTSPAHVRILGPAELERDGEIVRPTGRPGALFALLVAGRGVLLPTERLVDELWSGSPPLTAASAFRVHLGRLRNMGAREYIADARAQYGIRAHLVTVDATLFERELARARQLGGDKSLGEAVLSYEIALSYWRGDAFQGFTDVPSLLVESNRLQELREGGRDELIELLLVLGRNDKVIEQASAPAGREWMRERRAGYLMTALYRSGRQQEALDVFGRLRRGLLEEMGLDPTPELQRLERAILWQSPDMEWRRPAPDDEGVVDLPIVPVTWVGREEVLDAVRSAWGRIVVVVGASGMGKTGILAKAAAEWAGADDVAVVFGAAEREGAEELGPFVQALGRALRLPEEGSDSALIIDAVREAIRRLAGEKRLVILLDDFQWADTQSVALLDALARRSLGSNVAIVVATWPASDALLQTKSAGLARLIVGSSEYQLV